MTGGTDRSRAINRRIAAAVQKLGLGMGVGSQRISIERPDVLGTFQVRDVAPDVLLIANLGGVQLNYGLAVDDCKRLVESIGADAIALHLNPLQEAIQPGGNTDFRGLIEKIEKVCHGLARPVIAKEIGCGISGSTARRLVDAGVAAIDVGGAGGTCWTEIERRRNPSATVKAVAATFREWGTATADAIVQVRAACPAIPLIASGGLRNGLDVAKCLALGADFTAIAGPVLKAAAVSTETVLELLSTYIQELKLAMFCTGSESARDLRRAIQGNPS
jgi:isopentenyl-diphosphate delta-isomerase